MPRKLISILENDRYYYDPIKLLIDRDEDLKKWHFSTHNNLYKDLYDSSILTLKTGLDSITLSF